MVEAVGESSVWEAIKWAEICAKYKGLDSDSEDEAPHLSREARAVLKGGRHSDGTVRLQGIGQRVSMVARNRTHLIASCGDYPPLSPHGS